MRKIEGTKGAKKDGHTCLRVLSLGRRRSDRVRLDVLTIACEGNETMRKIEGTKGPMRALTVWCSPFLALTATVHDGGRGA